ncbi:uncharacterized protein EKO05_0003456 [Ascochyta rabiei]|uniref:uncharacterized protein n=1 Tax=Didymella rabiei TaxID=5454 RepID=UPI00220835E2|nr:uncharacterized protein EKO05_0003456 [Ascochyta rabiei]UPX12924.1 hypothetical protein EKO05_0003456 [Ascochyta rabiei]
MGSRSTKVAAFPHVKAAASPVAPAHQHHERSNKTNETGPSQGCIHQAIRTSATSPHSFDDTDVQAPTRAATTLKRRYSEPIQTAAMATEGYVDGIRHFDAFEVLLVARSLMSIEFSYADVTSPALIEHLSTPPTSVPVHEKSKKVEDPEVQCISCCTQLPKEKDPKYTREVLKPCRSCNSTYCVTCVKGMFLDACKDSTRMPPRCCVQVHLHHVKPHLTTEEITEYRSKYEEWSTPKPFYCPISTCSVFIPERLLSEQAGPKGKRKLGSGIETPTSPNFQCPKCEGEICVDCRQLAHPGSLCAILDLGVDVETAQLLKAWGYKRCPKCSQGLKRMYGCNHMECRCGAHFCWGCLKSRDECEGGCDEDGDDNYGSDSEPDEPEPLSAHSNGTEVAVAEKQRVAEEGSEVVAQAPSGAAADAITNPRTASRPRNLDGGSSRYWEYQDLHFGDEPNDDIQDQVWDCYHSFEPYTVSFASSISQHPSTCELECVKCWCTMRSGVEVPHKSTGDQVKAARSVLSPRDSSINANRSRGGYGLRARGRPVAAGLRPAPYVPPRGLFRSDATIGTAPHLAATFLPGGMRHVMIQSEPMEGVQFEADRDAAMEVEGLESVPSTRPKKTTTASRR